ncbi:uncharacterized protein LOC134277298 [Saccostrea cucullata]|uniref:uncharacterized protein LOC134277298 n=1 Tax=Saccostrea cuccullata TaxID=36930 RepID=UPI002ECFD0FE
METKRQEISQPLKQVIVELYLNGEKMSAIARSVNRSLASVYRIVRKYEDTGLVENLPRSGLPRSIDDRDYRRLQGIVNRDRRGPLGEITAQFNENRATSVSQKTVKRRLLENGFTRGVYKKKVVIKNVN